MIESELAEFKQKMKSKTERLRNLFQAVNSRMITVDQAVDMALMDPVVIDDDGEID